MQFLQSAVLNPVAWANLLFCLGGLSYAQPPPPQPSNKEKNAPAASTSQDVTPSTDKQIADAPQQCNPLSATLDRLQKLFEKVESSFPGNQICIMQAWMNSSCVASSQHYLYAEPTLLYLGDTTYQSFRDASCKAMMEWRQGMPGRVWKSGSVQVIQNSRIIPPVLHPVNKLQGMHLCRLGEMLYIPVFDSPHAKAPVAILEALLSRHASDPMLVANLISYVGKELDSLQLTLCHPNPPPIKRACFSGRRPRPSSSELNKDQPEGVKGRSSAAAQQRGGDGQSSGVSRKVRRLEKMGRCKTLHDISSALKAAQDSE